MVIAKGTILTLTNQSLTFRISQGNHVTMDANTTSTNRAMC